MSEYRDLDVQGAIKDANAEIRNRFIVKVYSIVSVQLLLTAIVAVPFAAISPIWVAEHHWLLYVAYALFFILLIVGVCCAGVMKTFPYNHILLSCISSSMGIVVGLVCTFYTAQSVLYAFMITCLVFFGITAYACTTKTDFTGWCSYLCAVIMVFIMTIVTLVLLSFFGYPFSIISGCFSAFGALLISFYIVRDTQAIMGGKHKTQFTTDDYAIAALVLYLDIVDLFLQILSMMQKE